MKNFKIRCIDDIGGEFTKDKIYKVKNGRIRYDRGGETYQIFKNVDEINKKFDSQFELVEKEPLKVGDYVITKKKIKPSKKMSFRNGMIIEEPKQIVRLTDKGNFTVGDEWYYRPEWLKKVEPPKKKIFNINHYGRKTAMHCGTQKKANRFCEYLQNIGIKQTRNKQWYVYGEDTCFEMFSDEFTDREWFEKEEYTILEFDNFIFEEETKVEDYKGFIEDEAIYAYEVACDSTFRISNKVAKWYIDNGYAFYTKAEAERKKECLDIVNKYEHDFSLKDWKSDTITKYTIDTDFSECTLITDSWKNLLNSSSSIWFKTRQDAEKVIELIGYDDWCKYILNLR